MSAGFEEGVVLVVEPDASHRATIGEAIRSHGYATIDAGSTSEAFDVIDETAGGVDAIVLQTGGDGSVLGAFRRAHPTLPVIVMTESRRVEDAIAALREGATDYLLQPIQPGELERSIRSAVASGQMSRELSVRRALDPDLLSRDAEMVTTGDTMRKILRIVERVKDSAVPVLITGETGTGKELLARALHRRSRRSPKPFVAINCAALPQALVESELFGHERGSFTGADQTKTGRFVEAGAGTIFLDEVGELGADVQAKLLRVLQEREVTPIGGETVSIDARVVVATNRDLEHEVREGNFRSDLFYRLNVVTIRLPPLRERREEIPALAAHLLQRFVAAENVPSLSLSANALQRLAALELPGNVRELENIIKRSALLSAKRVLDADDIVADPGGKAPEAPADEAPPVLDLATHERDIMMRALAAARGNVSAAARALGIGRTTFYRRAKRYKIAL